MTHELLQNPGQTQTGAGQTQTGGDVAVGIRQETQQQVRQQIDAARTAAIDAARAAGDLPPAAPTVAVTTQPTIPFDVNRGPPQQVIDLAMLFFVCVAAVLLGLPLVRAIARRLDRTGAAPAAIPPQVTAQLAQLSQAVDAIAVEVERISEGQRFTTRLLSDRQPDPSHTVLSPAKGSGG